MTRTRDAVLLLVLSLGVCQEVVGQEPESADLREYVEAYHRGQITMAEEGLRTLVEEEFAGIAGWDAAVAHAYLGLVHLRRLEEAEATEMFAEAIRRDPSVALDPNRHSRAGIHRFEEVRSRVAEWREFVAGRYTPPAEEIELPPQEVDGVSDFIRRAIGEEYKEWGGTFHAPWFTPAEELIGRGPGSNAGLNHNRTPVYRDLFYELLVQPVEDVDGATVDIVDALLETERQQGGGEEVKRGAELYEFVRALEVFGEGRLPAEVGASLRLVGSAMNVGATMDQAERDAVLAYAAMRGFAEAREKVLWELVERAGFSDPEMIKGLELAQGDVREELEVTLEELREQARGAAGRGALFEEGFDAIAAGAIGVSVKGVLGASAVAGGLATGVAALAVRQIDRVVTAEDAEARLVLLSTLDRKLFEDMDPDRVSADEKLLVEQIRRHLSDLTAEAAAEYVENSPPLVREGAHQWAEGHPYYDDAVLEEHDREADIAFEYEAAVEGREHGSEGQWVYATEGAVESSPVVVDGMVYVGSYDNHVYALNAETGERRWAFEMDGPVRSSPAVVDGTVYVGRRHMYALDAETGGRRWVYEMEGLVTTSPAVVDGTVYVGSSDHHVYALDAETGQRRWAYETGHQVLNSPAVAAGTVYMGSGDNHVYALDAETGERRWRFDTGYMVWSSPTVAEGTVYVGSIDSHVYALDADTGERRWAYETGGHVYSSPAVVEGTVYVGSDDHHFYALDAETGERRWAFETGARVSLGSPVVVEGTLYVGSIEGHVYALDVESGERRWAYEIESEVVGSLRVLDGTVYVGDVDGQVHALPVERER